MNKLEKNVSLRDLNTFRSDYIARYYLSVDNIDHLYSTVSRSEFEGLSKLILGNGSNILFTKDFDGLVLKIRNNEIVILRQNSSHIWVQANAGVNWHDFVLFCVVNKYYGLENLSYIPGSVGASAVSNIGAYGVDVSGVIDEVLVMDLVSGEFIVFQNDECHFEYRDSIFKKEKRYLILNITFKLSKQKKLILSYGSIERELYIRGISMPTIEDVSNVIIDIRKSKLPDPSVVPNAGSFFKNPIVSIEKFEEMKLIESQMPGYMVSKESVKIPAAWLIDDCGWKGRRVGNVGVSPDHALVLIKYLGGTGEDVYRLSQNIQESVFEKWQIMLEPEVEIY